MKPTTIDAFHLSKPPEERAILDRLREIIDARLVGADSKIWHAHPVWFLSGNPTVGYSTLKDCVRLMFWSGQSFETAGLTPTGTFKAAEARFTDVSQIDEALLTAWLEEAPHRQWDYKNIVKRKGRLEWLGASTPD